MEVGTSNAEAYSLIENADSRWGKYVNRADRKNRLLGIVNYARTKHPVDPISQPRLKVYSYDEFINTKIKLEWAVSDLLHKKGFMVVTGTPGVGKSTLSLRFAEKLALGKPFLKWQVKRPMRTLFLSMEMPQEELLYFLEQMRIKSDPLLRENFLLLPVGYSLRLNTKRGQQELNQIIEEFQPEGIIFDSLGQAIADEISSEKVIFDAFDYVNRTIRDEYGAFVWFIHHFRKAQVGNKKPNTLDDLYGNQYIGAQLTSGIGMWQNTNDESIEIVCQKLRLAKKFDPFYVYRTDNLDFELMKTEPLNSNSAILRDMI